MGNDQDPRKVKSGSSTSAIASLIKIPVERSRVVRPGKDAVIGEIWSTGGSLRLPMGSMGMYCVPLWQAVILLGFETELSEAKCPARTSYPPSPSHPIDPLCTPDDVLYGVRS